MVFGSIRNFDPEIIFMRLFPVLFAVFLLPLPAATAPVNAIFVSEFTATLTSSPGEATTVSAIGDRISFNLLNDSGAGFGFTGVTEDFGPTPAVAFGDVPFSSTGGALAVTGVSTNAGTISSNLEYELLLLIGNFAGVDEEVSLSVDWMLMAQTIFETGVVGTGQSSGGISVWLNDEQIFSESVAAGPGSDLDEKSDIFETTFSVNPSAFIASTVRISLFGTTDLDVTEIPPPALVPLPATGFMLLGALGAAVVWRRRRSAGA